METGRCCPWWLAYTFDHPLRRLVQDPREIVGPYLRPGMTALDFGCGMGFFSIAMARMVGPEGRVLAADLQSRMLSVAMKRARRAGVADRITPVPLERERLAVPARADFALAMWVVHEVPGPGRLLREMRAALNPGARFLIAEPRRHVRAGGFEELVATALAEGWVEESRPLVGWSMAVTLVN